MTFVETSDTFVIIFFYIFVLFPLSAYLYVDIVDTRWQRMEDQRRLAFTFATMYVVTTTVVVFYGVWQGLGGDFKECGATILASLVSTYGIWKIVRLLVATNWLYWAEKRYLRHPSLSDRAAHFFLSKTDEEVLQTRLGVPIEKGTANICSFRGRKVFTLEGRLSSHFIDDDFPGNSPRVSWFRGIFTGCYHIPSSDEGSFLYRLGLRMLASYQPHILKWAKALVCEEPEGMTTMINVRAVNPFLLGDKSIQVAIAERVNAYGNLFTISDFTELLMRQKDFTLSNDWDERVGEKNSSDWTLMLSGVSDAECSQALSELPTDLQDYLCNRRLELLMQGLVITMSGCMALSFNRGLDIISDKAKYRECLGNTMWIVMERNPEARTRKHDSDLMLLVDTLEELQISPESYGGLSTIVEAGFRGVGCDPSFLEIAGKGNSRISYVEWIITLLAMAKNLKESERVQLGSQTALDAVIWEIMKLNRKYEQKRDEESKKETVKKTKELPWEKSHLEEVLSDWRARGLGGFEAQYRWASKRLDEYVAAIMSPIDTSYRGRDILAQIVRLLLQVTICESSLRFDSGLHQFMETHFLQRSKIATS